MSGTRIGFDIGSNSIKAAVIRGGEVRVEEARLPDNLVDKNGITLPHAFTQFLKQLKKERSLPKGPASLALPPNQVICRLVTMPKMTTEQLLMNLPYEFNDFIQGAADQYYCDYALCEPAENDDDEQGVPMMAAAAAKQQLAEYWQIFSRAGFRLKTLLPQEMALIQLAQAQGHEEYCFIDLGHRFTRITAIWRDRVQATRQIAIGGQDFDRLIADEFGVDPFLANTYKTANHQGVLDSPAVADLCERIAVEILKVLNFYQFTYRSSNLSGVYLAGGGAAIAPLRQAIANATPLELLDSASLLKGAGEKAAAGLFAAGAAMGGKGK